MRNTGLLVVFFLLPLFGIAQVKYPAEVASVLAKSGNNRRELEKAIDFFTKKGDALQLRALYFLVANMSSHASWNYYWADGNNRRVSFNELDYADFASSVRAFEAIRKKTPNIHPQPFEYNDADSIKADLLIDNIERAFRAWQKPWAKNISFADFCEYILPYRISVEPLENWRGVYERRFSWVADSTGAKDLDAALGNLVSDRSQWFFNTYRVTDELRKEPLPRLGALQLLLRQKGACEDIADLQVFVLRSQGIPATVDAIPYWAVSSGSHYLNVIFNPRLGPVPYEPGRKFNSNYRLPREPGKVIRLTYATQKNTVAQAELPENIPPGFLRTMNYKDVTKEYWETQDVHVPLFKTGVPCKTVYACVLNTLDWKPIWWAPVRKDSAIFTNMSKGAVYQPMYYIKGKWQPAGNPVAVGYKHSMILRADTVHLHTVHLAQQEKYLVYRPHNNYKLYYWDSRWKFIAAKKAPAGAQELVFEKVPENALLLLLPQYSQHKERPFIITDDGERVWW